MKQASKSKQESKQKQGIEFPQRYEPKEAEPRIQKFWEQEGIFKFNPRSKKPLYSIDTPPPTISGLIHMGHALSYTTAEFIARFWRMQGYEVFYPMGFDDNGLPSERYVEKVRGIRSTDYSSEEFIKICLEETKKGGEEFEKVWKALGISVDWSLVYSTINPFCQKLSQLSFIDIYKKGRIYRQEGPTAWCHVCQTAIAQAELEDSQRKSFLNTILFNLKDSEEKIKIATTRPELLAACVTIFVHPDDERYKNLVGKRAIVPLFGQEVPIAADDKVNPAFGTGIVMVCTFGDRTDIEWWHKHKLPLKIAIDKRGRLTEGKFKGLQLEEARKQIINELEKEGRLLEKKEIEQTVNVHERCSTPVEFYVSPQWYIRILDLKENFLELGEQIKWHPEHMKIRYRQWVEGLNTDWCISRQRYFGIPFPVWHCKKCGAIVLADESELPVDPTKVKKKCSCGDETLPDTDVMDTWATSAITPLINAKWKEKKNLMDKIYPMNLRPQGYEIIRTWAFYTIAKCWLHTGQIPWKSIMINGMGLDPHGRKMSKSKGNVVELLPVKEKFSADAIRFWATSSRLGEDLPYQEKDVATGQRLLTKLWNASRFVSEHIKSYKKGKKPKELSVIDRWLLSRLTRIVKSDTENFKVCEYSQAKAETDIFFWHEFCDNYLEMVKYRLYSGKDESAQYTLYTSLLTILKLLAPIIPHITEEIYQILFRRSEKIASLHISKWPEPDDKLIDIEAEKAGDAAKQVIAGLRQYKSLRKMPLNIELKRIIIECDAETQKRLVMVEKDIKGTMKVGVIEFGKTLEFAKESEIALDKIKINVFI